MVGIVFNEDSILEGVLAALHHAYQSCSRAQSMYRG